MTPQEKAQNARKVTDTSIALAAELRAQKARTRITNAQLVRKTGIARNSLADIMNGSKPPDVTQLEAICDALGIGLPELFTTVKHQMWAEEDRQRERRKADHG